MRVADLAAAFCVSERTIQKLLKELETENIIRRVPVYGESGVQKASKYIYTGDKSRLTGKEPSIDKIYDPSNPMKLRDFDWKGYFLIRALTDKPVTVIPNAGEILQELKRQGNNLNQAVRRCYFYPNEKEEVLSAAFECKKAYRALYSAIGGN